MKRLVVFREDLLPISQTFIKEQMLALRRWDPLLTGLRFVRGLDLQSLNCRLLSGWLPRRLARKLVPPLRELELAPPGMRQQLRKLAPALLHVHFATDLVAVWPLLKSVQAPILVTLHGYDINIHEECWSGEKFAGSRYPSRLRAIARDPRVHFIAVSKAIQARAIEYRLPPEKIWVKYIGVDVARFKPADRPVSQRKPTILFVGRMVAKKGPHVLIRAFARLRGRLKAAELIMIGEGPELAAAQQLATELNVPVSFQGMQPTESVLAALNEARVLCLPSVTAANGDAEGLGVALLEAQACGVPVVTSARGGATEGIIDGVTGFAFTENDVEQLSARLCAVLEDDDRALAMSHAARQFAVQSFDIRKCTQELEDLYEQLTA
ncbi:MAG: glycosyltransferase [Proteobacteria bacterium]|nr:glycosyltransferase [Pseudomonadota bacterium]